MCHKILLFFLFFFPAIKKCKNHLHQWAHRKQWVARFGLPATVVSYKTRPWFGNGEEVPHTFEGGLLWLPLTGGYSLTYFTAVGKACHLCEVLKLCISCLSVGLGCPTPLSILYKDLVQFCWWITRETCSLWRGLGHLPAFWFSFERQVVGSKGQNIEVIQTRIWILPLPVHSSVALSKLYQFSDSSFLHSFIQQIYPEYLLCSSTQCHSRTFVNDE